MIVKMKKITLLCMEQDRDSTLAKLRDLGVMHLDPVNAPESDDLDAAIAEGNVVEETRCQLELLTPKAAKPDAPCPPTPENIAKGRQIVEAAQELLSRRKALSDDLENSRKELAALVPYGNFNPDTIRTLAEKGIIVKLYQLPANSDITPPENTQLTVLRREKTTIYVALVAEQKFSWDHSEFATPEHSLAELEDAIDDAEKKMATIEGGLKELVSSIPSLLTLENEIEKTRTFLTARSGMGTTKNIAYLQGFCPVDTTKRLQHCATNHGWGLLVEDPSDEDAVPTLIKYPRWVKPIKALIDMINIVPGYHEADISAVFLLFFSIFFAMLIGDAGYGALFLLLTVLLRRKLPSAPFYPFALFGVLSLCTIGWGVITGNYFGIEANVLPVMLQNLRLNWLTDPDVSQNNIMKLCFFIGALHLTIAHIWNAVALYPNKKFIAQLGWTGLIWTMFYGARTMVLSETLPNWTMIVGAIGMVAVIAFMTAPKDFKKDWISHAMLPLTVIGSFVDVISYIRLFAVGMATFYVAKSFNDMAIGVGFTKIWTAPLAALILLFGHGLNILLCALGILVHGVRLNTLEFSTHKELEWAGSAYKPFSNKKV